ncbi:hypothetical protein [Vibrio hepatarius]|nr:hypothetical protein [Vibrio hepatarius]MBU2898889.1 hypothetical protein [Vibrio hepatarius]
MKTLKILSIAAILSSSNSFSQPSIGYGIDIIKNNTSSFTAGPWDRIS